MLRVDRSLRLNIQGAPELPRVDAFTDLYKWGWRPRRGDLVMIAGRSGSGKSTFAEFLVAEMGLPTLYFAADMTPYEASIKLACSRLRATTEQVEEMIEGGMGEEIFSMLAEVPITFSFGEITWKGIAVEMDAYVELWNRYPEVIVIDNLMDVEDCESDYTMQQEAMQFFTNISRETGATVIVLHHATDKSRDANIDPYMPPARKEIKNGMSEKPQNILTVALNPFSSEVNVAVVKQRMGKADQSAAQYTAIYAIPDESRYEFRPKALTTFKVVGA